MTDLLDDYVPDDEVYKPIAFTSSHIRTEDHLRAVAHLEDRIKELEETVFQMRIAHLEDIQKWQGDIQALKSQIADLLTHMG